MDQRLGRLDGPMNTMEHTMTTLQDAARTAGLREDALLAIAKADLAPADAIADLQGRFPNAFSPVFDARTASKVECAAWMARHRAEQITKQYQAIDNATLERARAKYGDNGDRR